MKSKINFQKTETHGASYHGVCYVFSKKSLESITSNVLEQMVHLIQIELKLKLIVFLTAYALIKKMIQSSGQKFLPPRQECINWLSFAVCQSVALKNGFSQNLMEKNIIKGRRT